MHALSTPSNSVVLADFFPLVFSIVTSHCSLLYMQTVAEASCPVSNRFFDLPHFLVDTYLLSLSMHPAVYVFFVIPSYCTHHNIQVAAGTSSNVSNSLLDSPHFTVDMYLLSHSLHLLCTWYVIVRLLFPLIYVYRHDRQYYAV